MAVTLCTSSGPLSIELFCEDTPTSAKNFLALCAAGYYNNTTFHRNVARVALHGGDPTGTGKGGEAITAPEKPFIDDEIVPSIKHNRRGLVGYLRRGTRANSNGSQFFILYDAQPSFDGKNTIFGEVCEGLETLAALEQLPVDDLFRPISPITIDKVIIHSNPFAARGDAT